MRTIGTQQNTSFHTWVCIIDTFVIKTYNVRGKHFVLTSITVQRKKLIFMAPKSCLAALLLLAACAPRKLDSVNYFDLLATHTTTLMCLRKHPNSFDPSSGI